MKFKEYRLKKGKLTLNMDAAENEAVKEFVCSGGFRNLPPETKLQLKNPRSAVWKIDVPGVGRCILKQFCVVHGRGAWRKFESRLKLRFVHRGLRTMRIALKLADAGVPTFIPYAFWTDFDGEISNFLLYRFVEGEIIGDYWMGELSKIAPPIYKDSPLSPEAIDSFMWNAGQLVRRMHEAGVLHSDLHPKNFVSPSAKEGAGPLSLIDLDSAFYPKALSSRAKFVERICSIRKLAKCFVDEDNASLKTFVKAYSFGDLELEKAVIEALRFWRPKKKWKGKLDFLRAKLCCRQPTKLECRAKRSYDLVLSIGQDCKCSQSLRAAGLQHYSYPFDWLAGASLLDRAKILATDFRDWFNEKDLIDIGIADNSRFAVEHRIARHSQNGLEFRHDFSCEKTIAEDYASVNKKYLRRITRLISAIEKANRVLVVYTIGFRGEPVSLEQLVEARTLLANRFGEKIELLGIFDDFPNQRYMPMEVYSEDRKAIRWSLPCMVKHKNQEYEISGATIVKYLSALVSCPSPHTARERRQFRQTEKLNLYKKYKATTFIGMVRNRMLFRKYRSLKKKLIRKGIIS